MKKLNCLLTACLLLRMTLSAQEAAPPGFLSDSSDTRPLHEVVVKAYEQNRKLIDVGAPVAVVTKASLDRFNNSSILSAMNLTPGVRMEERSPGSYRLNIRGSSIRSPFGVRDIKIYYNEIPLTDPGGNTYLNELGFYNFQSLEVITGDPLFIQSALSAVREWRYRPTILDGQPIEVDTHITVIYTLNR